MGRAAVTVVVPCRDRPDHLARCLAAVTAQLQPGDAVLVIDSASRDAAAVASVVAATGARLLRCDQPGAARARNAGWQAAGAEVVAFVDDDVVVSDGWLEALAAAFAGPDVAFAAGRTTLPDGHAGAVTSTWTSVEPPAVVTADTAGVLGAGNLALRRSVLAAVGGFDERLGPATWFAAGEDVELVDRVLATGTTGRYVAAAVARHEQWRSGRELLGAQWAYGKGMGARVALLLRRSPRAGVRLVPELVRLGGLRTAVARGLAAAGPRRPPTISWLGPVLWRAGAVAGFVAGLVVLRPSRPLDDLARVNRT